MTLAEAEADERFNSFKFMGMLELGQYIAKCQYYIAKNPDDPDLPTFREFLEAAQLINKSRVGVK